METECAQCGESQDERHRDSDEGHLHGCSSDVPELVEVHVQADVEEQEDRAEFPQELQRGLMPDYAQSGRSEQDPGQDFGQDGRLVEAFSDLGCRARSDEDDQQPPQKVADIHAAQLANAVASMIQPLLRTLRTNSRPIRWRSELSSTSTVRAC